MGGVRREDGVKGRMVSGRYCNVLLITLLYSNVLYPGGDYSTTGTIFYLQLLMLCK